MAQGAAETESAQIVKLFLNSSLGLHRGFSIYVISNSIP